MTIHNGTIWTEPCRGAPPNDEGHRLHAYRRPVVAASFLNDLERKFAALEEAARDASEAYALGRGASAAHARLRAVLGESGGSR